METRFGPGLLTLNANGLNMHTRTYSLILGLTATALLALPATATAQAVCQALDGHALSNGSITAVTAVDAGQFRTPSGGRGGDQPLESVPAFCRVEALLAPVSGSEIRIEVWLPQSGWNNRLVALGNGGFAGSIGYPGLGNAVATGYAAASTDTGHAGGDPSFALEGEALTDFGHRAIHEMTVAAKSVVEAHYNSGPQFSYFNGCSTGGRQALTAAQRYPTDFDAIIAGAAANNTVRMTTQQLWTGRAVVDDPAAAMTEEHFASVHLSVMAACDGDDGVVDGILENPQACTFDPGSVASLTNAQVNAVRNIYRGAINSLRNETIYPGLARGSELGWMSMAGGTPFGYAENIHAFVINQDPDWNWLNLDFGRDLEVVDERVNSVGMQAIDPNLEPFFSRGGKLLMYHGWNDPLISPFNSVNYYTNVVHEVGGDTADASVRLFMMPGVNHCRGGAGTDTWDQLSALDAWRTAGDAPARVNASHLTNGQVDKTRPLCAYPSIAVYRGTGDTNDAANFDCRLPDLPQP
jgi:feruloyl esterase